ncbi:acetylcholinesterase-like [Coturnix japonica]|uniref:acetylcholinesterase-like n=1 Tax=Coturnix japonica TaxID=93934 RepID=UPI00077761E0|nr:acetylcholinesterase-like [Coturnix japonica]
MEPLLWLLLLSLAPPTFPTPSDFTYSAPNRPEVRTTTGSIRGLLVPAGPPGVMAAAFLGIPYAIPPIGSLRFRPPVPITTPWGGVRDTDTQPYACYQMIDTTFPGFEGSEMWNPNREMNEDCLYLNVWTPKRKPYKAPVLVWVYGGGFYSGSVSLDVYDGRYLAVAEDAIVISMNYRVGSIGFLALVGYRDAPGNVGLWDQRLALQWIRVNAEAFGGDPNRVTLFGESAGAASIGLHLLSPYSKGLFNRAVLQSGSPNGPWATIGAAEGRRRAALLGKAVGCPYGNETELVGCLKGVDALRLVEGEGEVLPPQSVFRFAFVPVVDGEFLIDSPEVMLGAGYGAGGGYGVREGPEGYYMGTPPVMLDPPLYLCGNPAII